ncbi:hypothetical protein BH11BAC3_BH11BAC3_17800 [soil metagenome]
MSKIPGLTLIKSASGRVTHAKLSMKHHKDLIQNMLDLSEMDKARKGDTIPWEEAKKNLEATAKRKSLK